MKINDVLIKKVGQRLMVPENVVASIVTHQFDSAHEALQTNNSVELYDFGKFVLNKRKAKQEMEKYRSQMELYTEKLNSVSSEGERKNILARMATTTKNIDALKLHNIYEEDKTDI